MNILQQIWNKIIQSDNQPLLDKIALLKDKVDVLQQEIDAKNNVIKSQNVEIVSQDSEIDILYNDIKNLEREIEILKNQLDTLTITVDDKSEQDYFNPTTKSYEWKPDKIVKLRQTLGNLSQDTEYIQKYNEWLDSLGVAYYNSFESTVYHTHKAVLDFVHGRYKTDLKAHGTKEYWFSPQEAFDYYVTEDLYDDCDGVRSLAWGAIVARLVKQELWVEHGWRLKAISISIEGSGGHAILTVLKDNFVWGPLETTFAQYTWEMDWHRDCDVFKSMYGNVYNVFDENSEYTVR